MAEGSPRVARDVNLAYEEPGVRAYEVPIQPDTMEVDVRHERFTLRSSVEVKGHLYPAVSLLLICLASIGSATAMALLCRGLAVPYWWLRLLLTVVTGIGTFIAGRRRVRPPDPSPRCTCRHRLPV